MAWCAGFLVAPAINRSLLDPPTTAASHSVRTLLGVAFVLFFVGWALALLGAAPVVARAVLPALRSGSWSALRPLLPALILGPVEAAGLIALALTPHPSVTHPPGLWVIAALFWLAGFAAFIASIGVGPALSLARLEPAPDVLRVPTWLGLPLAITLAALTGCSLAAAVMAGNASLIGSSVPVVAALTVGCVASLVALVSSGRAALAVRTI